MLAALSSLAKVYVGNDTGPMHIAAAVGIPVVGIFGGGTWPRFLPQASLAASVAGEMPCFGCGWSCLFADAPCLRLVGVDDVTEAVDSVLRRSSSGETDQAVHRARVKLDSLAWALAESANATYRSVEFDRSRRLGMAEELGRLLRESETDRAERLATIEEFGRLLRDSEADRAARLAAIEDLGQRLGESEADRAARLVVIEDLEQRLRESEADRAERGATLEDLEQRFRESEADRAARLVVIERANSEIATLLGEVETLKKLVGAQREVLEQWPARALRRVKVLRDSGIPRDRGI